MPPKESSLQMALSKSCSMSLVGLLQYMQVLSDSNTSVNSMINRRVSLFYRYPLEASHHMVCPC